MHSSSAAPSTTKMALNRYSTLWFLCQNTLRHVYMGYMKLTLSIWDWPKGKNQPTTHYYKVTFISTKMGHIIHLGHKWTQPTLWGISSNTSNASLPNWFIPLLIPILSHSILSFVFIPDRMGLNACMVGFETLLNANEWIEWIQWDWMGLNACMHYQRFHRFNLLSLRVAQIFPHISDPPISVDVVRILYLNNGGE